MMNELYDTIGGKNIHVLIQNFAINGCSFELWNPKMWKSSYGRFSLVITFDDAFATQQTLVKFPWMFQWKWYVLNGLYFASCIISYIFPGLWNIVNGCWFFLPFIVEFLIGFRQLWCNSRIKNARRNESVWISSILRKEKNKNKVKCDIKLRLCLIPE